MPTQKYGRRNTGFTLVEILAVIIILSILTSLSIVAYQKTLETNDERICQQQQKILQGAIEAYTIENDSLPNELAQLKPEHIHLAYLKVTGQRPGNKLLAFWQDFLGAKPAIAQTLPSLGKYYNYDTKILFCPADKIRNGTTSYKINTYDFIDTADLKDPSKANTALLYDKDAYHKKAFSLSGDKFRVTTGPTGEFGKAEYSGDGAAKATVGSGIENVDPLPTRATGDTQISEDTNDEIVDNNIINTLVNDLTPDNCCVRRVDWKALKKGAKKKCKDAGFKPQKKDGTCVDKCFNHCPSSGITP